MSLSMQFKGGWKKVLDETQKKMGPTLEGEIQRQSLFYIGDQVKKQMTGRKGNIYVNVVSGNLRRSWFAETKRKSQEISAIVYSIAKYAGFLEEGTRYMPKRLFMNETYAKEGLERYKKAFRKVMA